MAIPKRMHFIWVGDDSRRPDNCIMSWVRRHPDWEIKLWGNDDLGERPWINTRHILDMAKRELNGVADLMRWEILFEEGGIVIDADSICVRPLDDQLLEAEMFACWENELVRPGLIAAGYVGAEPGNPLIARIIADINAAPTVVDRMAWETVGPKRLTDNWRASAYANLTIYPSHYFIPRHFTGIEYTGPGTVYAKQEWASTLRSYDQLHEKEVA